MIAPPTFLHCFRDIGYASFDLEPLPWTAITRLNGGNEFEFSRPLRPGDVITGKATLASISSRQSRRMGPMIFVVAEMTYTTDKGEEVGKQRSTTIYLEAKD